MHQINRRRFLGQSGAVLAGASALGDVPPVHAAGSDIIRVGLIGCGSRGGGAARHAMQAGKDVRIVALGDVFRDRLEYCRNYLKAAGQQCAVKDDHCFSGFDNARQVIASGVDVVLLAEPPHFRPAHLQAAVAAGKHVFAEKPVAVDAPGVRRVDAICKEAQAKNLSIVSGLMLHYDPTMQETVRQIRRGAIGDIIALQCIYNVAILWVRKRLPEWSDMEYQLRNWYYYTWLSGDHIVEQFIHCLDLISWVMKGEYPVRAFGLGGRQARTGPEYGHIFDHHAACYEYASGVRCFAYTRQQNNTTKNMSNWVFGSKGTANLLDRSISGSTNWVYRAPDGGTGRTHPRWGGYQEEHDALFASIRSGKPINNGDYMTKSTLMAILGRMATYTGLEITWDQAWNSKEDLTPKDYKFGPMPEPPVAIPGVTQFV
jgi:predicted dehydrogenase